jgi:uncharacterized protein YbaP (TraB family)
MDKKRSRLLLYKNTLHRRWKQSMLLSAGLLSACLSFSQTPHTLLWQISGKGLVKPSYLFGTMHVLCAEDVRLSDSLRSVIAHCDEVYFEIDLSDMSGMLGSMKFMRMNDSKKLSDLLSPGDYQRVKTYFSQHSPMLPFGMLERFKPMLVSSLIEESSLGCKTTDGMELMIMKELHNKQVNGLETVEFQAGLFDSIPYEQQAKDLVNYIDSSEEYKKMTMELAEVYKQQDLDRIDSLSRKGDPGMSGYMDLLLYGRNRKWASQLATLLPAKSLLIAVGAAHLPGENGVIDLLRKQGYTLTPVKN